MDADDFELVTAYARDRSELAFRELARRHTEFVYSICRRRLRDAHLAEDAVQKVFIILASKAGTLAPGPLRPFLFTLAIRQCRDIQRKQSFEAAKHEAFASVTRMATAGINVAQQRVAAMQSALERIPALYRDVIELRYTHGFSVSEVAAAANISQEAAKKRLLRGLSELRSRLSEAGFAAFFGIPSILNTLREKPPAGFADQVAKVAVAKKMPAPSAPTTRPRFRMKMVPLAGAATLVVVSAGAAISRLILGENYPSKIAAAGTPSSPQSPLPNSSPLPPQPKPTFKQLLQRPIDLHYFSDVQLHRLFDTIAIEQQIVIKVDWSSLRTIGIAEETRVTTPALSGSVLDEVNTVLKIISPKGDLECVVLTDHLVIQTVSKNQPSTRT